MKISFKKLAISQKQHTANFPDFFIDTTATKKQLEAKIFFSKFACHPPFKGFKFYKLFFNHFFDILGFWLQTQYLINSSMLFLGKFLFDG